MHLRRIPARAATALLLAIGLWSCEPHAPSAPESLDVAQARFDRRARQCSTIRVIGSDGQQYTLAMGGIAKGRTYVERVIGPQGGKLMGSASGHSLTVPSGAVEFPTRFQFQVVVDDDCVIEVELEAEIEDDELSDAEERRAEAWDHRFRKKVILALSYKDAINVQHPERLRILWDRTAAPRHSGVHEPVESEVDPARKEVRAGLDHFSAYCLASW